MSFVPLEKCPYCGSDHADYQGSLDAVYCHDCGGSGPHADMQHEAELAWNRRAARPVAAPLREALEQIKAHVCGDKIPNWTDGMTTTRSRMYIADLCDRALSAAPNNAAQQGDSAIATSERPDLTPSDRGTLGELTLALCDALDDSVTLLEGWINRYCHPRHTREHMNDVAKKRQIIVAVRRQLEEMR